MCFSAYIFRSLETFYPRYKIGIQMQIFRNVSHTTYWMYVCIIILLNLELLTFGLNFGKKFVGKSD